MICGNVCLDPERCSRMGSCQRVHSLVCPQNDDKDAECWCLMDPLNTDEPLFEPTIELAQELPSFVANRGQFSICCPECGLSYTRDVEEGEDTEAQVLAWLSKHKESYHS